MSVEQYQRSVNSLDKDIAALEKKKAEADKKCAELSKKISSTEKSITSRTSTSTIASKLKQISGWESDRAKESAESADLAYTYTPSDEGEPGMIEFTIVNGIVQQDYHITKAENDYRDLRLGHASARLLRKLAQQDALPADRVFPLQNVHISK